MKLSYHVFSRSIRWLSLYIIVMSLVSSTLYAQKTSKRTPVFFSHHTFDTLLQQNVRGGEPYFEGFDCAAFYRYCDDIASARLDSIPANEHMAFWLNAINSCVIRAVILRKGMRSLDNYPDFYTKDTFVIAGNRNCISGFISKALSLHPHPFFVFGIFHGSHSDPPLIARAFHPQSLESVLRAHLRSFLRSDHGALLDIRANTLTLPSIFQRYSSVWGTEKKKLLVFVRQYLQPEAEAYCAVHAETLVVTYAKDQPLLLYRQSPPKDPSIKPWEK